MRLKRSMTILVWAVSLLVVVLIMAQAAGRTIDFVWPIVAGFPGPYGRAGLLFITAYLFVAAALIVLAQAAASEDRLRGHLLPLALVGTALVVRIAISSVADAPLTGENRIVYSQALGVLDGACCFGHRPMGYPIALAGAFGLVGIGPHAVEALNIVFAIVTTWLIWDIGRISWNRRVGAVASMAYAVMPSAVLMTLVPLTEPMYTAAVCAVVWLGIRLGPAWVVPAIATAAAIALAQYVRATAVVLLLPASVLPLLTGWGLLRTAARGVLMAVAVVILLAPVIAYNARAHGDLSVATSAYGGWSLYVGANHKYDGRWNREDSARLGTFPGETVWDRSKHAGRLAWARYTEDPGATLDLFVRKFRVLWGDEQYAAAYALPTTAARGPTREMWTAWLVSQLSWLIVLALAGVGLAAEHRNPRPAALLIGMIVILVATSHLLLEVHSRYHAYLVPLLLLPAAAGLERLRHGPSLDIRPK
jgi:4-amino-4-deoxy-L-arabinose transferase-like glycosyltransferase